MWNIYDFYSILPDRHPFLNHLHDDYRGPRLGLDIVHDLYSIPTITYPHTVFDHAPTRVLIMCDYP